MNDIDVLIFYGGWSGHEPADCSNLVAERLRAAGLRVRVDDNQAVLSEPGALDGLRLIVPMWTMGEISKEASKAIQTAVRAGCGLGGWHGGMCDAFRQDVGWQFMTGGQWVSHPGGIIDYTVRITDLAHPIMQGVCDFPIHSEQYYMHVDPAVRVLATTIFSGDHEDMGWIRGVEMPVVWTKPYGAGRVFYSSLGHVAADLRIPQVERLLTQGLLWAASSKT